MTGKDIARQRLVSQRITGSDFDEGKILLSHILRPTRHFVTPTDIRWMLGLTAPIVKAFNTCLYRPGHAPDHHLPAATANGLKPTLVINGQIAGTWRPTTQKGQVRIETFPFTELSQTSLRGAKKAAEKFTRFVTGR